MGWSGTYPTPVAPFENVASNIEFPLDRQRDPAHNRLHDLADWHVPLKKEQMEMIVEYGEGQYAAATGEGAFEKDVADAWPDGFSKPGVRHPRAHVMRRARQVRSKRSSHA